MLAISMLITLCIFTFRGEFSIQEKLLPWYMKKKEDVHILLSIKKLSTLSTVITITIAKTARKENFPNNLLYMQFCIYACTKLLHKLLYEL